MPPIQTPAIEVCLHGARSPSASPAGCADPGDQLRHELITLTEYIGRPYPHGEIHAPTDERKQSTRLLKFVCPGCGYLIRTTRTWLEVGVPVCCCGEDFKVASSSARQ